MPAPDTPTAVPRRGGAQRRSEGSVRAITEWGPSLLGQLEGTVVGADGRTNREIGESLFISHRTVGDHVSNLLAKLGASRRTEAGAIAHREGLTSPSADAP